MGQIRLPKKLPPTDMALRAAQIRVWRGLSQEDMATAVGTTGGHWSDIEAGKKPLTWAICDVIRNRWGPALDWQMYGDVRHLLDPATRDGLDQARDKILANIRAQPKPRRPAA